MQVIFGTPKAVQNSDRGGKLCLDKKNETLKRKLLTQIQPVNNQSNIAYAHRKSKRLSRKSFKYRIKAFTSRNN